MKMARSMFPSGPAMLACCFVVLFVIVPVKSQIPPSSPAITGDSTFSVGDTGSFVCSSSGGLPDPSVKWFRNGQLVDDTYALTSGQANTGGTVSNTVSFTVSASDHYAVYECQVDNGVTQDPLKLTKFLLVRSTPNPPTLVGPTNPPPGQQNNWTCTSVGSFPPATMTMRRGNQQYTANEFTTSQQINGVTKTWTVTGTLTWTPTVANNGDILYCDVAHETLAQPQTVNLPLTVVDPLAVNAPVTSYNPTIGTTVTLNCVVTSGTPTSIVWLKDNNVLNINTNSRYSIGNVPTPSLTITNVQQSDQGNYVCRAVNSNAQVNTNDIIVTPQGTPPVVTIPQSPYSQYKGQSITLVCQVSSPNSPLQAIQWTFTNSQNQLTDPVVISTGKYTGSTTSSPSLTINNLVEADRGTYRCRGTNLIGSTLSNPTELRVTGNLPVVQITENPINRIYGSQVTIPCVVSNADPAITNVYWTRNQNGVTTNINSGQNGYSGSTTTTPSLTINFATQNDNGVYTCLASNIVGTGTSNPSTVTITGGLLTVQISPASEEVLQGTTKTITCTVSGQPAATSISWRKTSNTQVTTLDIANSNGKYSGGSTGTPSLTISNFQSSDAASYVCSATNAAGTQSSSTSVLTYKAFPAISVTPTTGSTDIGTATYTITCTVIATPQATSWSWTKTPIGGGQSTAINQGTNDNKYTVANSASSPSLTIKNIQTSDQANYVCTATNSAGTRSSGPSQLTVTGGLLGVTIAPSNQMVIRGNSQTITCTITGTPAVQAVTWLKNSQTVTIDGSKYSSGGSTNTPTLTITNFQSSDAATYNCRATNAAGSTLSPNSVLTYGDVPSITVSPPTGSAVIGTSTYTITCTVTATPEATSWSWTKTPIGGGQSTTINQGTNDNKYTVANSASSPSLTIKNIQTSDQANYVCSATNVAGSQSSGPSQLTVTGGLLTVAIAPANQMVIQGNSQTITCTITGTPPVQSVEWRKNSQAVTVDGSKYTSGGTTSIPTLMITNFQSSDAATYTCRATNAAGTRESTNSVLTYSTYPSITVSPTSGSTDIGTATYTITCTVTATPEATTWSWTKTPIGGGQSTTINQGTNDGKYTVANSASSPSLTISNIQTSDQANYVCSATNVAGTRSSGPSQLTVTGGLLTVSISPANQRVLQGTSQTITCTITGTPPVQSVEWRKNSQTVTVDGSKYTSGGTTSIPTLTISNFQFSDAATYTCRATNAAGTSESTNSVLTYGTFPDITVTPTTGSTDIGTATYTITCTVIATPQATSWSWTKTPIGGGQSTTINQGTNDNKYTVANSASSPSLTIKNIQTSDQANYVCSATNVAGTRSSGPSQLTVTGGLLTVSIDPANKMVIQGNSQTITCTISGTPAVQSVQWTKNQQTVTVDGSKYTSGGSLSTPTLTINNFQSSDAATYTCRATNAAGSTESTTSVLTYGVFPSIVVSPPTGSAVIGTSTYTITCTITATPEATSWSWTKTPIGGGQSTTINQGTNDNKYMVANSASSPSLTIKNIQTSDQANYVCSATNIAGTRSSGPSQLTVTGGALTVTISPTNPAAVIGDSSVQIQCTISGTPSATAWYWTFLPLGSNAGSEQTISQGTNNAEYTVENSNFNPHLTIKNIVLGDAGDYVCHGTNLVGTEQSSQARLTVTGELLNVAVTPLNAQVIKGNSQTITCTVSGTPPVTAIAWTKETSNGVNPIDIGGSSGKYSGGTTGNPSLTITNFESTDAASYVCMATNAVGTKSSEKSVLTYAEFLTLQASPSSGSATIGDANYKIDCFISGSPTANSWFWTKTPSSGGQSTTINQGTNSAKYTVDNSATNPSLTIKGIVSTDDANYQCTATNVAGQRTSNNARLLVTGGLLSIIAQPSQQSPIYGTNSVTIQCSISGSPGATSVGWRKVSVDGTSTEVIDAANSNGKYSIVNSNTNPDLTISNIVFTDEANYVCFAENVVGSSNSANALVDVTGKVPVVTVSQRTYTVTTGLTVQLVCTVTANPSHTQVYWLRSNNVGNQYIYSYTNTNKYSGSTTFQPSLTIYSTTTSDTGQYICLAQNTVGTGQSLPTTLTVSGTAPQVSIPQTSYNVIYGQNAVIQCNIINANPAHTTVTWYRVDNNGQATTINVGDVTQYSGGTLGNPTLTVLNVNNADVGLYRCGATNIVGEGLSGNAQLNVIGGIPVVQLSKTADSVLYGNSITLDCTITYQTPSATKVFWQHTRSGVTTELITTNSNKYSGSTIDFPSLTINNAVHEDDGEYQCFASNIVGVGQSSKLTLNIVGGLLSVTVQQTNSVLYGNTATLTCSVTGSPSATNVFWSKKQNDGSYTAVDVNGNNRYSGGNLNSPNLIISNAVFTDEGVFRCSATNAAGTANSLDANLDVTGNKPDVTIGAPSYSVDFGSSVTLGCTIVSNPPYSSVQWTKYITEGSQVSVDFTNTAKYSGSVIGSPSLTIKSADLNDKATYTCSATNSVGTGISAATALDIVGGLLTVTVPSISYSVPLGQSITLGCSWSGIPPANFVTWQKVVNNVITDINVGGSNGKYVGATVADPSLTITGADNADKAEYICTATNAVGRANSERTTLDVTGSIPNVRILQQRYTVNYGNTVTLECIITSLPVHTKVTWTKNRSGSIKTINPSTSQGKYNGGTVNSPSLIISKVNLDDEASYICSATNQIGTGSSTTTFLDVVGGLLSVSVPNDPYDVQIGQSITIPCIITGNPAATTVRWKKIQNTETQDIDVINSGGKYSGSSLTTPALTINNAAKTDSANYQCTATNVEGTSSSQTVFLNVFGDVPNVQIPGDSYNVNFGGQVIIPCTVSANPTHISVTWKKLVMGNFEDIDVTQSNVKYSGSTVTNPDLTIKNANLADEASYMCTATNTIGTGQSQTRFLDVIGGLLTVSIPSTQYSAQVGEAVRLVCQVSGTPTATSILWKKILPGRSIMQSQDIDVTGSNGAYTGGTVSDPSLTITNAKDSDGGSYICTATNAAGTSQSQETRLTIIGSIPNVVILDTPYTAPYGQTVTIKCQVTAAPSVTSITWTKTVNGITTTINTADPKYSGGTVMVPSLTITNVNIKNDEGNYVCSATNSIGTGNSASVFLDVIGGLLTVNIQKDRYTVQQGNSVQMICSWSGTPAATSVTWKKYVDGTPTDIIVTNSNGKYFGSTVSSPSLTINSASQDDVATYVCTATNAEGTSNSQPINLEVTGGIPSVLIKQPSYTVDFGNYIILECSVIANPSATSIQWYKIVNGQSVNVDTSNTDKYSGGTVSTPSLTILGATNQDEGNYVCSATNSIGSSQSSQTFLDVIGDILSVVIPKSEYDVEIGNSVTLECQVTGSPAATKIYWTKRQAGGTQVDIDLSQNKYSGSTVNSPSLVISNANKEDATDYICWATNAVGSAQSSPTKLNVVGNPPTVTISSTSFPVLVGNTITLGCNIISNPPATDVFWTFTNLNNQATVIRQNSNTNKYGGISLQSPSLTINNAAFSDEGKYACSATNIVGTSSSQLADLDVTGQPPTVSIPLPNYSVDFGQSVTITCTVTSNPAHFRVFWRQNKNGVLTEINVANSNGKYSGSTLSSPSLVINNAALDDQASYTCYAENSIGQGSSSPTVLTVTGNIPQVNIQQSLYNVNYGDDVTLVCTVVANPQATSVYWQKLKNGQTTIIDRNAVDNDARLSGVTLATPSLTITNVNLNDLASYTCFAQNIVGTGQSSPTSLQVSGAPPTVVVLSTGYAVDVGGQITLQCVVTSNPVHTSVKWQRLVNGQLQDVTNVGAVGSNSRLTGSTVNSPSLTISQTTFNDEGSYICTATNDVGTGSSQQTFLDVRGTAPTVTIPQSSYAANFGSSFTIPCTVSANPTETRVYWKKLENGAFTDIDMNSARYSGSTVGGASLTISGLTKADQTFYQCFADNTVGTGSSQQTFLRVDGDPPTVQVSSTSYSVTLGQNAVLGCTVSGNPSVNTVFWRKYNAQNQLVDIDLTTNNNNKYQGSTTTTPSLTILNTVSSDAGRYVCFASNIVGTGQSVVTTLSIVGSIPNVIIPQSSYNVNIGNQITLGCTVSATPQETDVYWTKKVGNGAEQTISKTNSGKYQGQSVASPSLIILNTDLADIATYYCYATNSVGTGKSNPTSLTVTGNIPTVVIPSPSYSVNYDQSTSIPCTVTASPTATSIQWKKLVNGQEQNIDTTQAKYSGATVNSPALTISNADNNDQAIYICTATNSVGTGRSQQTVLNVVGDIPAVSVGSNSYSVLKTQNKVLECTITANPAATSVQWYRVVNGAQTSLRNVQGKYNTPTVNSPNLVINNADDQDRGFYICTASNVVGTGTSQNTYLDVTGNEPIVTIPLSQYNGNIGSSVTINCQVVANPAATSVYWIKTANGQSQTINSGTNRYSFSVNSPSLVISNVVQGDEGNYICYATNVIGTGNSQSTFLDILGSIPQVTILQQSYNTNIGGSTKLECTVTSNPSHTKVYWKKVESNGQTSDIVIDGTKYQGSTLQDPSLTINNAQLSDRTSYICLADNSVGTGQSGQTYLNVIGSQPIVTIPQSTYSVRFGSSIQIPCSITSNPTHTSMSWKRILNGVVTVIDAAYIANNANKYSGGTLNQPSLTINTADRATDQAFYECSASNSVGTGTSSRTFLTVTGSIPVVQIPNNIYPVEIGQSVQIPCTISSDPTHFAVQWQRQDANGAKTNLDVTDQTKYNNGNLGTPTLTILNAANADEGYYLCTATNAVGTGTSSLTYVDVTGSILQVTVPQTSYNVNYGQSVQLVCTVSGTPSATDVYWIKISNGAQTTIRQSTMDTNKYSGASLGTPSLTILNANEADSALYRCYAQNVVGTGQSQQTQLNVIGSKPSVTVGPPATVNLGNSVTLQCTVIATPSATSVQWNKITNGQPNTVDVGGNPNKYSGGNINVPSLTIFNAQNSDQASYTCQATNAAGTTVSTQTSLTVEGNLPVVTITNQQYSVVVGNSVTLGCTVQANPAHTTVYWRKIVNGQPTALPTSNRYTGSTVSNPSLTINNLVPSDLGNYRCFATNSVGTGQSEQTYLNVVGSAPVVNVVSTSYQTNIGNTVTLGCTVVANPAATNVAWKRLDSNNNIVDINMADAKYTGSQPNSPSLVISNPVKSDEGRYYCTATNLVGTGQSQNTFLTVVGSIPTVTITDPTYSVNRGSTVTLQCSYTSNPVATMVRWTKDGVNLGDVTNNNNYGGSTTSSPSLIIYDANENDEGTYRCEVTNSVGTGTSSATVLNVVGNIPTVTVPIGAYTVLIGGSISLQCSVTADPVHTRVYWQKVVNGNPVELNIDGTKLSGSTVNTPQLNINNAASSDAGTYYCLADNSVGTGRSTQVVVGVTGNKPEVTLTRTTTTANFGDDVVIQCNVVASPAATSVYWQKSVAGGNPVTIDKTNTAKYQGGTVAIPSLTIKNVNLADIGKYTCFAANSVGTGQSTQGDLNVVGSVPQVRVGAGPFTQNIGNSIQISCTVTSNPPHTNVYWTRRIGTANEATIDTASSTKYSVSSDISNPTLTIFNIQETDEGQYTCYATNAVGTGQSTSAYLNVVGNVPAVSASIPAAPVRIGESVVITCTVNSNPAATKIIWQRINSLNNQASNLDMTVAKYSGGTVTTPSLTINPVLEGDEGAYRCQAENDIGTGTSNTVNLLTSGDPPMSVAITPSPIVVQEGNIIAATCTATGNPTPSFAWYKASNMDVVIDTDANLRITNAQESNKGSYVCRATNKFGSNDAIVSVDVQFRPRVVIPELTVVGKRGTNIEIKCTQTSNPLATSVAWTRISNGVVTAIPIDNMKYFGATVLNPSLTITNADASDIGSYRCSATNAVGTGSSENAVVQVDLRYAPIDINIYPDGITVLEGRAFSMYCNSSANPSPTYEWFHDDIKIQTGQTYSVSVSDYNKHDGLYTCKASNEIGFLQKSIDVDVKYPPISNIQQNTFAPVLNSPLTLECDTLANPSSVKWEWYYNDIRMTDYPDNRKDFVVDMNEATDAGKYSCIAFNEVGQSSKIVFTVVVGPVSTQAPVTTTAVGPNVGETVASAGLTAGEIAAIILGILFLIFLLIAIIVCCILQGCCICCAAAGGRKEKERRITPDREKVIDIPRFYEVPTVVTREPSLISKRDVSLHMAPAYRPSNDYEITKYRIVRPDDYVDDRYLTSASRPYYLPAIEYTYDAEEERRRRRRKKKRSRRHDDLQRDEQIVVEERVVGGGDVYRTSSRLPEEEVEVVTGPEFYFERE